MKKTGPYEMEWNNIMNRLICLNSEQTGTDEVKLSSLYKTNLKKQQYMIYMECPGLIKRVNLPNTQNRPFKPS